MQARGEVHDHHRSVGGRPTGIDGPAQAGRFKVARYIQLGVGVAVGLQGRAGWLIEPGRIDLVMMVEEGGGAR